MIRMQNILINSVVCTPLGMVHHVNKEACMAMYSLTSFLLASFHYINNIYIYLVTIHYYTSIHLCKKE